MQNRKKISIMTPCYNEEESILKCIESVHEYMTLFLIDFDYEHLIIDNASTDRTVDIVKNKITDDDRIKLIVNSRNFGPHMSPYYGILQCKGDAVIPVMADLQTPIELIKELVLKWENGADKVIALRVSYEKKKFIDRLRNLYYLLMVKISHVEHNKGFTGFGLYDRKVVDALNTYSDPVPYFRTLISEVGFKVDYIEYEQKNRKKGLSKNNLYTLLDYALLGITSTNVPMRLVIIVSAGFSMLFLFIILLYGVAKIFYWDSFDAGIVPILMLVLFIGSMQMFIFGLLGEYITTLLQNVKNKPLVIEKERYGKF
jgi:polyisoprenyl-phosphate glycosyltransferase